MKIMAKNKQEYEQFLSKQKGNNADEEN